MRKTVQTKVKGGGISKASSKCILSQCVSTTAYDNQSIPLIFVRNREIPLVFINRPLQWHDLDDNENSAVTNDDLTIILFKDQENIICLLATSSGSKLKKNGIGGLTKEWLHNYSILYIKTRDEGKPGIKNINYREKEIRSLNRIITEGTNIKRYPSNGDTNFGTWFPEDLNYTTKEDDPSYRFLFEVRYGGRRGDAK